MGRGQSKEQKRLLEKEAQSQGRGDFQRTLTVLSSYLSAFQLLPDQLVLLLELLLEVKSLSSRTLHWLQKHYCLREQDAEVRHRWCELVIKHKHTVAYRDLIHFLEQDQAMGVYLYGELMVNEDARQQQLVHRCFTMLQEEMDPSLQKVVAEMIF